jgi:hypothetical protein
MASDCDAKKPSVGEEQLTRGLLEQAGGLAVGEVGFAEFAVGVVAREDEQQVERSLLGEAGAQSVGSLKVVGEPLVFAAAVGTLAVDEVLGGWVDRGNAVQLPEDPVFGRPEADRKSDRLGESRLGIRERDGFS